MSARGSLGSLIYDPSRALFSYFVSLEGERPYNVFIQNTITKISRTLSRIFEADNTIPQISKTLSRIFEADNTIPKISNNSKNVKNTFKNN